ncbi:protein YIPF1 homolog isoform X2 [Schistocerca gregaria]|uniref:protein YIPF1 homolog isoform X2 n=1 Tax=Schistocerca gregaria TaxID=7010 RepID=UPI00211E0346|nr:protein YIPF1 homolog isoform X2 [Schistocerca gregaria]
MEGSNKQPKDDYDALNQFLSVGRANVEEDTDPIVSIETAPQSQLSSGLGPIQQAAPELFINSEAFHVSGLEGVPSGGQGPPIYNQQNPHPGGQPAGQEGPEEARGSNRDYSIFSVKYFRSLFDVDTDIVLERIFFALLPYRQDFLDRIENPDLYGYVWGSITFIFALAMFENLTSYFGYMYRKKEELFFYDLSTLPVNTLFVLLFMILVPLAFWGLMTVMDEFDISLPKVMCLYGYSVFAYIIGAVLCAIPFGWVRWVSVLLAFLVSSAHIGLALWPHMKHATLKTRLIFLTFVVATGASMALFMRLYSFGHGA